MTHRDLRVVTYEDIAKLVNDINFALKSEQTALSQDDPESTCASYHRGSISAYGFVLRKIQDILYPDPPK